VFEIKLAKSCDIEKAFFNWVKDITRENTYMQLYENKIITRGVKRVDS
jgi:hypothetical protein